MSCTSTVVICVPMYIIASLHNVHFSTIIVSGTCKSCWIAMLTGSKHGPMGLNSLHDSLSNSIMWKDIIIDKRNMTNRCGC